MTIDMREAGDRLRVLHVHDQKIRRIERDIHDGPARLSGLQTTVAEIDKKIRAVEERAMILRAQIKLRENELKGDRAEDRAHQVPVLRGPTNKEFVAFRSELSNYQAEADRLQGEVLKILEVVDAASQAGRVAEGGSRRARSRGSKRRGRSSTSPSRT